MITRSSSLATSQTLTPELENPAHDSAQIPESVPSYTSFADITDLRQRRALEYEQFLLFSLDRFPDYAPRINSEINWARSLSRRTQASDQDRITKALELAEESTCQEVADDTGLPSSTVYKILRRFLDSGFVKARSIQGCGNKPTLVYSLSRSF